MSESSNHSITRRGALRGAAVATAATLAAPGIASAAEVLGVSEGLRTYRGRYALPGGRIIEGYFVAPRSRGQLDTIVVLHGEQGVDARAQAVANYYAASGKLVVVPDMPATYPNGGRAAQVADLKKLAPNFGKRCMANGNVQFVAA